MSVDGDRHESILAATGRREGRHAATLPGIGRGFRFSAVSSGNLATRAFAKTSFPTELVYGSTPLAELRLITCTGTFDRASHNYAANLVVTAYAA
jgi:hypothetical protein